MIELLIPFLFIGGIIAFFIIVVAIVIWGVSKSKKQAQKLCTELGPSFKPSGFGSSVEGSIENRKASVEWVTRSKGKHSTDYFTIVRVFPMRQPSFKMKLTPQGVLAELGKKLGMQDIEFHDPHFDKKFAIAGSDENMTRFVMNQKLRSQLLTFSSRFRYLQVNRGGVSICFGGHEKNTLQLKELMKYLSKLSEKVESV